MVWPILLPTKNLIISSLTKIENDFTFLVPAYPGCSVRETATRAFLVFFLLVLLPAAKAA